MTQQDETALLQPDLLRNELFTEAKRRWAAELLALSTVVLLGVVDSIFSIAPVVFACLAALVTVVGWFFGMIWKRWNDLAQRLSRLTDFYDAFGWKVPPDDMAEIRAIAPNRAKKRALKHKSDTDYFASKATAGPTRAVENVRESAFWSRAMCMRMVWIAGGVATLVAAISIAILVTALNVAKDDPSRSSAALTAMAVLTAGSSIGLWTLFVDYLGFVNDCKDTVASAKQLLAQGSISDRDAIVLWGDYHIARAAAPPIPTWLMKLRHDEFNNDYRQTYHPKR